MVSALPVDRNAYTGHIEAAEEKSAVPWAVEPHPQPACGRRAGRRVHDRNVLCDRAAREHPLYTVRALVETRVPGPSLAARPAPAAIQGDVTDRIVDLQRREAAAPSVTVHLLEDRTGDGLGRDRRAPPC